MTSIPLAILTPLWCVTWHIHRCWGFGHGCLWGAINCQPQVFGRFHSVTQLALNIQQISCCGKVSLTTEDPPLPMPQAEFSADSKLELSVQAVYWKCPWGSVSMKGSMLVFWGFYNKFPPTGWLKTREFYSLVFLGSRSLKSRYWQVPWGTKGGSVPCLFQLLVTIDIFWGL